MSPFAGNDVSPTSPGRSLGPSTASASKAAASKAPHLSPLPLAQLGPAQEASVPSAPLQQVKTQHRHQHEQELYESSQAQTRKVSSSSSTTISSGTAKSPETSHPHVPVSSASSKTPPAQIAASSGDASAATAVTRVSSPPAHISIPSRLRTTGLSTSNTNNNDGSDGDGDNDEAEVEFLTPIGRILISDHTRNPFSLPQSPADSSPSSASAPSETSTAIASAYTLPGPSIPLPPPAQAMAPTSAPSSYRSSSSVAAKRSNSTRSTAVSSSADVGSEAGETDDIERSSLMSSSAGGSSSLGRSGSCASTTPTSPGLGPHHQEIAHSAGDVAKGTAATLLTSKALSEASSHLASGRRDSCPQPVSLESNTKRPQEQANGSLPSRAHAHSPARTHTHGNHNSSTGLPALEQRAEIQQHTAKARRGSFSAIRMTASSAITALRLTARSQIADDDRSSSSSSSHQQHTSSLKPASASVPHSPTHPRWTSSANSGSSTAHRLSPGPRVDSARSSYGGNRSPLAPANPNPYALHSPVPSSSPSSSSSSHAIYAPSSPYRDSPKARVSDRPRASEDDYVLGISTTAAAAEAATAASRSAYARRPKTSADMLAEQSPAFGSAHASSSGRQSGMTTTRLSPMPTSRSAPAGCAIPTVHRLSLGMDMGVGLGFNMGASSAASASLHSLGTDDHHDDEGEEEEELESAVTSASVVGSTSASYVGRKKIVAPRLKKHEKERLRQKPLPPGPPDNVNPERGAGLDQIQDASLSSSRQRVYQSQGSISSSTQSTLIASTGSRTNAHPSSSSLVSENTPSADGAQPTYSASTAASDHDARSFREFSFMERMIETPVTLLSPPLEDPREMAMGAAEGGGGTVRMGRTPSTNRHFHQHRRIKSSNGPEDYFGAVSHSTGMGGLEAPGPEAKSLSSSPDRRGFPATSGRQTYDAPTVRGTLSHGGSYQQRYALRRAEASQSGQGYSVAKAGLGMGDGTTLGDGEDALPLGMSSSSANSSRKHLARHQSTTVAPSDASTSTTASGASASASGRMSSLGRRLSAVFDHHPPLFKSRASMMPASMMPVTGKSRSHAGSAAPSEPGSPIVRYANPASEAFPPPPSSSASASASASASSLRTGSLLPPLEHAGSISSRSRPGSSIGFFRRFDRDRKGSVPVEDGVKASSLIMDASSSVTSRTKSSPIQQQQQQQQQLLKSPSKIPVRTGSPVAQAGSAVLEPRTPSKKAHSKTGSAVVAVGAGAGLAAMFFNDGTAEHERSMQMSPSSSSHSRSPSANALKSTRRVDSPPAARVQSRSSLALAEIEANIEAAAAKVMTSTGLEANGWTREVRALFVIREILQTERSYAKHLEALVGAVRKTAARSSSAGGVGVVGVAAADGTVSKRKGGAAGLMTYSAISSSKAGKNSAGPAPHIVIMKTLLPPMIVLSRSLAARIEQNPTAAGVGAAFTLLQEQIEANFVSWSRAIGAIMDALRASESAGKGKSSKDRIGMIAPCPAVNNISQNSGPFGASVDALALTRPSSSMGTDDDVSRDTISTTSAYPIWATDPDALSMTTTEDNLPQRRRSNSVSLLDTASASAAVTARESLKTTRRRAESFRRSASALSAYSSIDVATANRAARRLGATNDDLRLLDTSKWEPQTSNAPVKGASPSSKTKNQSKKAAAANGAGGTVPGSPKMFEPQDLVIMPTQRVVRYILLMKDLLANTPVGGNAYARVERALEVVTVVAEMCNKVARPMGPGPGAGPGAGATPPSSEVSSIVNSSVTLDATKAASLSGPVSSSSSSSPPVVGSKTGYSATPKQPPNRRGSFVQTVQAMPRSLKKASR